MQWQIESSLAPAETALYAQHAHRVSKGIGRFFRAPPSTTVGALKFCRTAWQFSDACASFGVTGTTAHTTGICIKTDHGPITVAVLCGHRAIHDVLDDISHECFHAFSKSFFAIDLPMWLEEGLAMDFGSARFSASGLSTGHVDAWRLEYLQHFDEATLENDLLIAFESKPQDWHAAARDHPIRSQKLYSASWLAMHAMLHGGDTERRQAVVQILKDAAADREGRFRFDPSAVVEAIGVWCRRMSADPTAIARRRLTELSLGLQHLHQEQIAPPDSLRSLQNKMRLLIAEYRMHTPGGPPRRVRLDHEDLYWYPDDQGLDFEFDQVESPKGCPQLSLEAAALPDRPRLTWFNTRANEWSPQVILRTDPLDGG